MVGCNVARVVGAPRLGAF